MESGAGPPSAPTPQTPVIRSETMAMREIPPHHRKLGLALGGGVARGWAHIGVLRALARHGIRPDVIAGCSAGALVGGVYLAGHLDTLEEWTRSLTTMRILSLMDLKLTSGSLIGGEKLIAELVRHVGDRRVEDLETPFITVATDLVTGHEVWLRQGSLVDAMRASYAMPGIFPPAKIDGRWLVDGALVDPVPVAACRALGAVMVVAVNLNADLVGQVRRPENTLAPGPGSRTQERSTTPEPEVAPEQPNGGAPWHAGFNLDFLPFRKRPGEDAAKAKRDPETPGMFNVMATSLTIALDRITRSRLAGEPPDVHLTPRLGHIGLLEFDRAAEAIAEGEAVVERALPELVEALDLYRIPHSIGG